MSGENWDDLRIFLAVAREGSITGGAKRLGVQHSTVSRRLRALEDRICAHLFFRKPSGYALTDAGEDLYVTAARVEAEILKFDGEQGDEETEASGELRVSAINNMASTILMPIFARFHTAHPEIELHVLVTNKFVRLAERDADIAIRLSNDPLDTLIGTQLVTVASAVYGAREYCARVRAGEASETWLGVECCGTHMSWTRAACPDRSHNFFVDDTLLTLAALKSGAGLAYLPCFMGDSAPELARLRPPEQEHDLGFWLVYHRDLRHTKRVRLFREHMRREIAVIRHLFEGRM